MGIMHVGSSMLMLWYEQNMDSWSLDLIGLTYGQSSLTCEKQIKINSQ